MLRNLQLNYKVKPHKVITMDHKIEPSRKRHRKPYTMVIADNMYPIRCYGCQKVVGNKFDTYFQMLRNGVNPKYSLDTLGLKRMCCRTMMVSYNERTLPRHS